MDFKEKFKDFLDPFGMLFRAILESVVSSNPGLKHGDRVALTASHELMREKFWHEARKLVMDYIMAHRAVLTYTQRIVRLAAALVVRSAQEGDNFIVLMRARYRSLMNEWTTSAAEVVQFVPSYERNRADRQRIAKVKNREKAKTFYDIAKERVAKAACLRGEDLDDQDDNVQSEIMVEAVRLATHDPEILSVYYPVKVSRSRGTRFFVKKDLIHDVVYDIPLETWWVDVPVQDMKVRTAKKSWRALARELCALGIVLSIADEEDTADEVGFFDVSEDGTVDLTVPEQEEIEFEFEDSTDEAFSGDTDKELMLFDRERSFDGRLGALINAQGGKFARTLSAERGGSPYDGPQEIDFDDSDENTMFKPRRVGDDLLSVKALLADGSVLDGSDVTKIVNAELHPENDGFLIGETKQWRMIPVGEYFDSEMLDKAIDRMMAYHGYYSPICPSRCKMSAQTSQGWQFGKTWYAEGVGKVCIGYFGCRVYIVHRIISQKKAWSWAHHEADKRLKNVKISGWSRNRIASELKKKYEVSNLAWIFPNHDGMLLGFELRGEIASYILREMKRLPLGPIDTLDG